jgi:radical SAM protein with 4Fe4S-binding SPASM domain
MDCPHIPELAAADFYASFVDKVVADRVPVTGSLELTFRCNLRCAHCYITNADGSQESAGELTQQEISRILDEVVDEGCLWLLMTGGEPLVRRDFLDIYTDAKKKGLLITLFTNGTLLTPYIADYLADWRPYNIEITIYGRTRETYERVTGIPGSYDRCMRGIELLLARDLPLKLKTMAITLNKHELWDMKAYAESLGTPFRFDALINASMDGSGAPKSLRLEPKEVVELDLKDNGRMERWREFCQKFLGPPVDTDHLYTCGAGRSSFHIDPFGQLSVCMMVRQSSYDLRSGSFRDGWRRFIPQVRAQTVSEDHACARCELRNLCGQCPGWASMETGNPEARVEYLCQVAHLRAEAFGLCRPTHDLFLDDSRPNR